MFLTVLATQQQAISPQAERCRPQGTFPEQAFCFHWTF